MDVTIDIYLLLLPICLYCIIIIIIIIGRITISVSSSSICDVVLFHCCERCNIHHDER
jgi:hypothetical protein